MFINACFWLKTTDRPQAIVKRSNVTFFAPLMRVSQFNKRWRGKLVSLKYDSSGVGIFLSAFAQSIIFQFINISWSIY